jgi:hypothetical protein
LEFGRFDERQGLDVAYSGRGNAQMFEIQIFRGRHKFYWQGPKVNNNLFAVYLFHGFEQSFPRRPGSGEISSDSPISFGQDMFFASKKLFSECFGTVEFELDANDVDDLFKLLWADIVG